MVDTASRPVDSKSYLERLRARRSAPTQSDTPASRAPQSTQAEQTPSQFQVVPPHLNPLQEPHVSSQTTAQNMVPAGAYELDRPAPEEFIYQWQAPSRPFKKRDRQFYFTIAIIVILVSLILFFAGQFLPIAVVVSVAFVSYVLSSVPPETVTNRISTYGIYNDDAFYYWEELGRFWFDTKFKTELVQIESARFPGRITLLIKSDKQKQEIQEILSEVLLEEKPKDTFFDKAGKWLQDKIPLDSDNES